MVDLYLIDTSAWIEWFRKTDAPAAKVVASLRAQPESIAVTQPIVLEVRAGTRKEHLHAVERILNNAVQLGVQPDIDFLAAADLYGATRDRGKPVRSLVDCLVAAVAIRTGAVVVHQDHDFDILASVAADLRTRPEYPAR